ncbi:hypothetical protein NE237_004786 [Protea cynaroides]|uniref:Uncharacterized protein n=1 Tax=Protea cynaroides TaxID=273540 RepID=A0A9Q0KJI6_9MAGN|nr:hypothetical protein NE237_004786 [Protea cynaroides]
MSSFKPIKVLDRCNIAPPPGSVTTTSTVLPLTFFDIHWLPLSPVELLFFYEFPYPISQFMQSHLPNLKRTLSSTLIHFYPLAGNLSWPMESNKPMICYTKGDSVSFTLAESNANFNHLSSNDLRNAIDSRPLVPHLPASGSIVPMLAIQVTIFPNSGICIGVTHHHSICDGRGFTHFMKTWASISTLESSEPLPLLDRTVVKDHDGITKIFLDELDGFMGSQSMFGNRRLRVMDIELKPNMVRATFELNEETSKRLKERFNPPSRLVAICAYTWVCLVKAEAKTGGSKSNSTHFVVNVDCRARLDPIIPKTYFGNCVIGCVVNAEKTDLIKGGVAMATQLIRSAIQKVEEEGILRGLEDSLSSLLKMKSSNSRRLGAAGSPQFGFYKIDLGFGRPKKVEMASNDRTGSMFLKESSNLDGGIEFDLVLNRQEMDAFVSLFVDGLHALKKEPLCPSTLRPLL